ncbi:MAG: ABC transporter permease [Heliobacteriaceae bacterium]|nr:ABC transporter permease [Heliobacteriaceae bacterium]MDD4588624.1 ABC transporter permease [Heliobacteriaceae bacterium]
MNRLNNRFRASWSRFLAVFKKEIIQIKRDKPSLGIAFGMPIMMLLLFGYAVNTDVDNLPTVVWDQSRSAESRELLASFVNTGYFGINQYAQGYQEIREALDGGQSRVALVFPPDYAANLQLGKPATVQVFIDGSDPQVARTALSTAQLLVQAKGAALLAEGLAARGIDQGSGPLLEARPRIWYNPDMKSLVFNIPALIGLIMQNVTIMLTAFALVRERERGTMEQLVVTPVRPAELLLGKLAPYVLLGLVSFSIILAAGIYWFGVPVKGSVPLLVLLAILFLFTSLSIGLLISTFSRTQLQAMQLAFMVLLPSILLSGFIFPRETMPWLIRGLGNLIPLTYFLVILRGIFLKDIGLAHLQGEVFALLAFAGGLFLLAVLRFRKNLD